MHSDKETFRKKFLELRKRINDIEKKSEKIQNAFLNILETLDISNLIIYSNTKYEPRTNDLIKKLLSFDYKVYLPITHLNNVARITNPDDMKKGINGFFEPVIATPALPSYDMIILPGLAFDYGGFRLGHGKGWYDKFLKKNVIKYKIGFSFNELLTPKLPHDPWDMPVNIIITDKNVHKIGH